MDNYTGPFWSDGKIQNSVEFGLSPTYDEVDTASRLHDSAFAHFGDARHRRAADKIYQTTLSNVSGFKSALVRNLPLYGNFLGSDLSGLLAPMSFLNAALAIYAISELEDEFRQGKYDKEIADVMKYYTTDPTMGNFIAPAVYPDQFLSEKERRENEELVGTAKKHIAESGQYAKSLRTNKVAVTDVNNGTNNLRTVTVDAGGGISIDRGNGNSALPGDAGTTDTSNDAANYVSFGNLAQQVSMLGAENLSLVAEGSSAPNMAYNPYTKYQPLKKKKIKITKAMVKTYNKYHGTRYTLEEIQNLSLSF